MNGLGAWGVTHRVDDTASWWIVAAPLFVIGVLTAGCGWRGAARHLAASSGWARWWSVALLLPAVGSLMVAMGALLAAGAPDLALDLMYGAAGFAALAAMTGAIAALRAEEHRTAVWRAGLAAFLAIAFGLIAAGWHAATDVLLVVASAGLLISSLWLGIRRWRGSDTTGRRRLLQSVAFGVGFSCQAAIAFVPAQQRSLSLVLMIVGLVSLLVALGLIVAAGRARRSSSAVSDHPS